MNNNEMAEKAAFYIMSCTNDELKELTVTRLAGMLGVDRCTLGRKFKEMNSCTLQKFLLQEKLFRSAALLRNHNGLKISEVSEMMGFLSPDHFSRVFTGQFGIMPSKYKKYGDRTIKRKVEISKKRGI